MRKSFQIALIVLSLIPLTFGVTGLMTGAPYFMGTESFPPAIDNQLRYLSGVYLLVTMMVWYLIPRVETAGPILRLICIALVLGGLGRAYSFLTYGVGDQLQFIGMILELGSPVLLIWQHMVAQRAADTTG